MPQPQAYVRHFGPQSSNIPVCLHLRVTNNLRQRCMPTSPSVHFPNLCCFLTRCPCGCRYPHICYLFIVKCACNLLTSCKSDSIVFEEEPSFIKSNHSCTLPILLQPPCSTVSPLEMWKRPGMSCQPLLCAPRCAQTYIPTIRFLQNPPQISGGDAITYLYMCAAQEVWVVDVHHA